MKIFIQTSTKREVVDITDKVNEQLEKPSIKGCGTWQRVVLIEFAGPRERTVIVQYW